ncbi:DEAD/DEAH box helicase, partial [Candidatus Gracilibacteria bacterium]|nr:DEAD/DEAH box helicase [Candidatus Gracilibacteria bacterium]
DNVDFYSFYDEIIGNLKKFISFSNLGNSSKNLQIEEIYFNNLDDFKACLEEKNYTKYIFSKNLKTVNNFLELNNLEQIQTFNCSLNNLKGFKTDKIYVICDDIISKIFIRRRVKKTFSENLDLLMQIKPGDFIVHIDHGVGIFSEITTKEIPDGNGKMLKKEYITIEYKNNDKLFVPIMEISRVSKYVGSENPKLTSLSTKDWEKKLAKVGEDVEKIASELLEIYAKRNLQKGFAFQSKPDEENEFFKSFEYVYTEDQHLAIEDIFSDMEKEIPMDRLLCGDVGFGKTEVAFAAIFKCLINEKQAALISPLVVLAYEHFEKAKQRFEKFPFNIEVITRFEKPVVIKSILQKLKEGKIDLIIGTHRILSEDVEFKNLGLLVIDEEHKFGVKDKEKIKKLKGNVDILSMSATPIPRSLNMALNGLRQVSMLTTPPVGKQEIQTIISDFNDGLIFDACKREFDRGGQVFFIHNRVETILTLQSYLEKILPGKKILVTHGQLKGDTLEKRIIEFKRKQYDILLSTTVIENGIDFSNVNTIFINDSINFGISQIHQLRGRVGRGQNKGYCYLLFNKDK